MDRKRNIVVIPAYEPDEKMIRLLQELTSKMEYDVIIVNDGSGEEKKSVFEKALRYGKVLNHPENKGKGEAIKTALRYIIKEQNRKKQDSGIQNDITIAVADADGQHKVADIVRVMGEAEKRNGSLILGSRKFKGNVPFRSKFGNKITSVVFKMASEVWLGDTQTGLRAFSSSLIPVFLSMEGSRYEYEMNVLLQCTKLKIPLKEVPIETVYIGGNESSHFHPVRDSYRIYKNILKFSCSSLISFLVDFLLYSLLAAVTGNIVFSNILARVVSASVNFSINRNYVFQSKEHIGKEALRYFCLAAGILAVNTVLLNYVVHFIVSNQYIGKVLVEIILFIASWTIQKTYVFQPEKKKGAAKNAY